MNERITHYCENYLLRTIAAAYESNDEEATGLAGELSEIVDSGKYRNGDLLDPDDIDLIERLNAVIPIPGGPAL